LNPHFSPLFRQAGCEALDSGTASERPRTQGEKPPPPVAPNRRRLHRADGAKRLPKHVAARNVRRL
jgi:hypothetical protein